LSVGQSLLDYPPSFGLGSNRRIVLARGFDTVDVLGFSWHYCFPNVIALAIVDKSGAMFVESDEAGLNFLSLSLYIIQPKSLPRPLTPAERPVTGREIP